MSSAAGQLYFNPIINSKQSEAMFRGLAENVVVGIYVFEPQSDSFLYVNDTLAKMLGYKRQEMLASLSLFDMVAVNEVDQVREKILRVLSGDLPKIHYERKARRKNGEYIDIEVFGARMVLENCAAVVGVVLDITRRRKAEEAVQLTSLVYQHSSEAMVVTDANGIIITVNPAFSDITGYALNDVIGRRLDALSSTRHDQAFYQQMWESMAASGQWQGEVWSRHKSGEEYIERLTINSSYNEDGSVRCRVALFCDITQKKKSEEQIWRQAHFDLLTDLPNRKLFHETLESKMLRALEGNSGLAVLYLDLDDFKAVNDALSHACGDEVLKVVAARLKGCVRQSDIVARLGGDEFCAIIDGATTEEQTDRICKKITRALAEPCVMEGGAVSVTCSIGVAFYPIDALRSDDLLNNASLAMSAAKQLGCNQYSYFTPGIREEAYMRHLLMRDLTNARAQGQFRLYYQPIVDMQSGRMLKAEALVRWLHPEHGLISPDDFLPFAEDSGLIINIGDWVFNEAARQVAQWRALYVPDFRVSINVSPAQFQNESLRPDDWVASLQRLGLPGESIVIEITEKLIMDAAASVGEKLLRFRDAGVQVALDDFGTGYSSLTYLKKFDIDYIKIDRSFINNLTTNLDDRAVCEAIIMMAHKLGMKVVAEGVETAEQCKLLVDMGCDLGQGYLFSRPLTSERFTDLLRGPLASPEQVQTH